MISLLERWAGVVLMSTLGGYYRFGPILEVDAATGIVALALGHFVSGVQFVVRETFVGTLPARLELVHRPTEGAAPLEIGEHRPYLAIVHTDGQMHVLAGCARVYDLVPRGYATPITQEDRRVPCLREPLPSRRLVFRGHDWEEGVAVGDAIELYRKLYFAA